jgi:glucose-1-phosphate adenylyltransferase
MNRLLAIVLAGGEGHRLYPLTRRRSKPAVPFGGKYRIIDFTLSNCINSGIRQIYVLTQYRSGSLNVHIQEAWGISSSGLQEYIYCVPAQQKAGLDWYRGTADAVRQNLDLLIRKNVDHVLILSGDHVYKMDYRQMLNYHIAKNADFTLSAVRVKKEEAAGNFGVLEVDADYRLVGFEEKPLKPKSIPDALDYALASMGIYLINVDKLMKLMESEGDDFGNEIIPRMVNTDGVYVYDYTTENKIQDFVAQVINGKRENILVDRIRDSGYWKDVGSIDSYYETSMDLVGVDPAFNLYGLRWPFRTYQRQLPPSKFIIGGLAQESIVSEGCIISGGIARHSILFPNVIIERDAFIESTIIFDDVAIEPLCRIRRAIIDKESVIKAGASLGFDHEADKKRGCTISDNGVVVVPRNSKIEPL